MSYFVFLIIVCLFVNCVVAGTGFYRTENNYKYLTLNIYNHDRNYDFTNFKNKLRIVNELLCTYNSYKIETINILEDIKYLPFSDVVIDIGKKRNIKPFLNKTQNLNKINNYMVINEIDEITFYYKLVEYLIIKKNIINKNCSTTKTPCIDSCTGNDNICLISYPVDLIDKSLVTCSRTININYNTININKKINILIYRHTHYSSYLKLLDILRDIKSINDNEKYNTNIDLFPHPLFNAYLSCRNGSRSIKMGFLGKVIDDINSEDCVIFNNPSRSNRRNGVDFTMGEYKRYKVDRVQIKSQNFLKTGETMRNYTIIFNDKKIPDNFSYERLNRYKVTKETDGINWNWLSHSMCPKNDIFTIHGVFCSTVSISDQLSTYNLEKSVSPEKYWNVTSNLDKDDIMDTLNNAAYGEIITLIITKNTKIFVGHIDTYINICNRKLLTLTIFVDGSEIPSDLQILIEKTNSFVHTINNDPFDYLKYISFLKNKQILKYNEVKKTYSITTKSSKVYQLITSSTIMLYDNYGNPMNLISHKKITNVLNFYEFKTIPGLNILIFSQNDNKFVFLKNIIMDEIYVVISNKKAIIYSSTESKLYYTLYKKDNGKNRHSINISLGYHEISYTTDDTKLIFDSYANDIEEVDMGNSNIYYDLYNSIASQNNFDNFPIHADDIENIYFRLDKLLPPSSKIDWYEKTTSCDYKNFILCVMGMCTLWFFSLFFVVIIAYLCCRRSDRGVNDTGAPVRATLCVVFLVFMVIFIITNVILLIIIHHAYAKDFFGGGFMFFLFICTCIGSMVLCCCGVYHGRSDKG